MALVLWDFGGTVTERPRMWRGCFAEALDEHEARGSRRGGEGAWMVGDKAEADVAGARRAGVEAILFRTNGVALDAAVDRILAQ